MTAKEYLNRYKEAERDVQRLKKEYKEELDKIDSIRSGLGDGSPHGTGISKKVEMQALRLVDKALDCQQAILDAVQIRQEVFDTVQKLTGTKKDVIYERYIQLKTWSLIADDLHYTTRQIYFIHRAALEDVEHFIEFHT